MADNITAPATGSVLATDEIGGVHYPRTKLSVGADGVAVDVSAAAPLPVALSAADNSAIDAIATALADNATGADIAAVVAALSDIATDTGLGAIVSTLAGTLTVDAASLPLPTGAATSAKQDTLIGHVDGIEVVLATLGTQTTLAAILAKLIAAPATEAKQDANTAAVALVGTRAYGAGQPVAIGASDAASVGLTATEVLLHASARCFVRVAAAATAAAGIPLEPGEKFHLRLNSGQQIHVIRDTADGTLNVVPVA
ncbi:hypothetical protein [Allopontixanthobacter sediminis]|uniref:Uncharacterized protein n=1 Tax=Allopontixanthobacter sediminis TaxID=1689985 RepID=A0A845B5R0_9SPHN|nr:hypothetical protein [Allopontixanthobacter sediminis]MXP42979.1 hypothetical protein [Allopontixanthobacter sediminis]